MAENAIQSRGVTIALACRTFGVSETSYHYSAKLKPENEQIEDLLIGLTKAHKSGALAYVFCTFATSKGICGAISGRFCRTFWIKNLNPT